MGRTPEKSFPSHAGAKSRAEMPSAVSCTCGGSQALQKRTFEVGSQALQKRTFLFNREAKEKTPGLPPRIALRQTLNPEP